MKPQIRMAGWAEIPLELFTCDLDRLKVRLERDLAFQTADTREFTGATTDQRETVRCYEMSNGVVRVPRGYMDRLSDLLQPGSLLTSQDCREEGIPVAWKMRTKLFEEESKNQVDAVRELAYYEGGILVAAPGKGKTIMGLAAMSKVGRRALVVVPTTVLLDQWRARAIQHTSLSSQDIGIVQGDICQWNRPLIIAMVQSLSQRRYAEELYETVGIFVTDECLDGETRIPTPSGWMKLCSLNEGDRVSTPQGYARILRKWIVRKPAARFTMQSGRSLIASYDHKVFTKQLSRSDSQSGRRDPNGTHRGKLVKQSIADTSALLFWRDTLFPAPYDPKEYLIGLYLGDGCWTESTSFRLRFAFGKDQTFWEGFLPSLAERVGIDSSACSLRRETNGVLTFEFPKAWTQEFLGSYGFQPGPKRGKERIPESLLDSIGVLKGLFDAEGYRSADRVGIDMTSLPCVLQIQEALAHRGILTRRSTYIRDNPNHAPRHRLLMFGNNARRFERVVGFELDKTGLRIGWKGRSWRSWTEEDRIVQVEDLGERELWDITLDDEQHQFFAEGYLVSNCHRISAPTWSRVVPQFPALYRWGLSATPERPDGLHKIFQLHCGPVLYEMLELDMHPVVYQMFTGVSLPAHAYTNPWNGQPNFARAFTSLSRDAARNRMLAAEIVKCHLAGRKVLILSKRVQHLTALSQLVQQAAVPSAEIGVITGQVNGTVRQRILAQRKVIFAIESIAGLGLDQPDLDTLIYALPSQSVEQTVGRIERELPGKKNPLVVDPVDDVPLFRRLADSRRKKYQQRGYEVVIVNKRP
jgi:superfamily II DNA or RNA helicase